MNQRTDVVVVGAGIAGLAHAWAAARAGRSVTLLERSAYAQGASIRNFGMVWPIGQPPGRTLDLALRSRELWIEAADDAGFWSAPTGSIYLAVRDDELQVMREFVETHAGDTGYACEMLDQARAWQECPAANRNNVIGGFLSRTEVGIDPREAIAKMPAMLADGLAVDVHFNAVVASCEPGLVQLADGRRFEARERVVICSGSQTDMLYPGFLEAQSAVPCKLQMLATPPQPDGWGVGPMIASGSTLRHYDTFAGCPSLPELKRRIADETPELNELGIHFMAAQNGLGEVVMGDSHEYGAGISPFDSSRIDQVLMRGLHHLLDLKDFSIARRWSGTYLKAPDRSHIAVEPEPGVLVFNGLGGAGMTLAFGLAEQMWSGPEFKIAPNAIGLYDYMKPDQMNSKTTVD